MSLRLSGIRARIGGVPVLHAVDLEIRNGKVTALLGRNGAGKTTTLRTVLGLTELDAGEITCEGRDLSRLPTWRRAREGLFYVPEDGGVFQDLSVQENLKLSARMPIAQAIEPFEELGPLLGRRAALLSGGERKILALARAYASRSEWLLIDEPSLGLAPTVLRRLAGAIQLLRGRAAMLIVEQNLGFAQSVADDYVLLLDGRTVDRGPIDTLRQSSQFDAAMHFGQSEGGSSQ